MTDLEHKALSKLMSTEGYKVFKGYIETKVGRQMEQVLNCPSTEVDLWRGGAKALRSLLKELQAFE